jgi:hypothetical protein
MPNRLSGLMPHYSRHEGDWIGTYSHYTPSLELLDRYEVRINSEFPGDGSCDFRLNTHNVWPDGRESRGVFAAHYRDGRLWFSDELIGSLWEIDDFTVYLRFTYRADPSIDVCEMIQISEDGRNRARTWHWFREQKLFKITLTQERRREAVMTA